MRLFDCKNVGGDCVRARRRRRVYAGREPPAWRRATSGRRCCDSPDFFRLQHNSRRAFAGRARVVSNSERIRNAASSPFFRHSRGRRLPRASSAHSSARAVGTATARTTTVEHVSRTASPGGAADREDAPFEPTLPAAHARWPEETAAFARGFDRGALRVVTWNLQLLPGTFAGQGGCPASLERRAKRQVDNVLALARATARGRRRLPGGLARGRGARAPRRPAGALPAPAPPRGVLRSAHRDPRRAPARARALRAVPKHRGRRGVVVHQGCRRRGRRDRGGDPREPVLGQPFAVLNAHAQSDFWASGAATRTDDADARDAERDGAPPPGSTPPVTAPAYDLAAGRRLERRRRVRGVPRRRCARSVTRRILAADARHRHRRCSRFPSARTSRRRSRRSLAA